VPHDGARSGTVAVLPLQDTQSAVTGETTRRTEELTNALGRRQVSLVERGQLEKVLGELRLEEGHEFDPATAQKVGHQLGVQAVLIGTLVPRGSVVDLNLRLVETETGRILDTPTVTNVPKAPTGTVRRKLPSLVGTWEATLPDGQKRIWTVVGTGAFATTGGVRGTWRQSGMKIVLDGQVPVAPGSRQFVAIHNSGEIEEDGRRFHVSNDKGEVVTAVRK
jgi:TolB-like protein